jgi:hypothetical protein
LDQFSIFTTYSPWLILACLAVGALYAWLLYTKKTPWSPRLNYLLAFLRFVVVSFLCFLLLSPVIRYISSSADKPVIVLAVDNSQSVGLFSDSAELTALNNRLQAMAATLQEQNFAVDIKTLVPGTRTSDLRQVQYDQTATNLDQLLARVHTDYENRNLAGVVLVSDGMVNQGRSPVYGDFNYTIYPVAVGDTVPKRDLILSSLLYNKVAYSGNRFPLVAEIRNEGFGPASANVILKENGRVIDRKALALQTTRQQHRVEFLLTAANPGKRHYEVEIEPLQGEFTFLNNRRHAYIDVVKGRLKVLLAAAAPHPDIKAIKGSIETNDNLEVDVYLPGVNPLKPEAYDLVILHQIPSRLQVGREVLEMVNRKQLPALYVLGAQSDLNTYNQLNTGLRIDRRGGQTDEVLGVPNPAFRKFAFAEGVAGRFEKYPPVDVPFADFNLAGNAEAILYQQVGKVKTNKPLLVLQNAPERRQATLLGDGIWQWKLAESADYEVPENFNKLVVNVVQLLSSQQNRKKLNVYPVKDEFDVSEEVAFEAELYNDVLERIYGHTITLKVTDAENNSRSFSFVNGENNSRLNAGSLPAGTYSYTATSTVDRRVHQDKGEFVVQELQLEALNAQADHNLLYQLASKTDSRLYFPTQVEQLEADILNAGYKNVLYSSESLEDLVNLRWLFFLLLGLVTAEWLIRKYNGSY